MRPEHASIFNALNDSEAAILTIYGEARGELFIGKQAVAQVIANRADRWHKTVKAVCFASAASTDHFLSKLGPTAIPCRIFNK